MDVIVYKATAFERMMAKVVVHLPIHARQKAKLRRYFRKRYMRRLMDDMTSILSRACEEKDIGERMPNLPSWSSEDYSWEVIRNKSED